MKRVFLGGGDHAGASDSWLDLIHTHTSISANSCGILRYLSTFREDGHASCVLESGLLGWKYGFIFSGTQRGRVKWFSPKRRVVESKRQAPVFFTAWDDMCQHTPPCFQLLRRIVMFRTKD